MTGSGDNIDIASLLKRHAGGDADASDALFGLIYDDLRRRAVRVSTGPDSTLSPTALVHETWLRLAGATLSLNDRAHFFRVAARAMRHVMLDAARRRRTHKRDGVMESLDLDTAALAMPDRQLDILALEDALEHLADVRPRLARIVELHFFAGLEFVEIAQLLSLSERTVGREWRAARALLHLALREADDPHDEPLPA